MLRRVERNDERAGKTNLTGWGLNPVKGRDLKGHVSASISGNWRKPFTFDGTDAVLVDDLDDH